MQRHSRLAAALLAGGIFALTAVLLARQPWWTKEHIVRQSAASIGQDNPFAELRALVALVREENASPTVLLPFAVSQDAKIARAAQFALLEHVERVDLQAAERAGRSRQLLELMQTVPDYLHEAGSAQLQFAVRLATRALEQKVRLTSNQRDQLLKQCEELLALAAIPGGETFRRPVEELTPDDETTAPPTGIGAGLIVATSGQGTPDLPPPIIIVPAHQDLPPVSPPQTQVAITPISGQSQPTPTASGVRPQEEPVAPAAVATSTTVASTPPTAGMAPEEARAEQLRQLVWQLHAANSSGVQRAQSDLARLELTRGEWTIARQAGHPNPSIRQQLVAEVPRLAGNQAGVWLMVLAADPANDVRHSALSLLVTSRNANLLRFVLRATVRDEDPRIARLVETARMELKTAP